MTTTWINVLTQGNTYGSEEITNGGFLGNANGWEVNGNPLPFEEWSYGSNNAVKVPGVFSDSLLQVGTLTEGIGYLVSLEATCTAGTLGVRLGNTADLLTISNTGSFLFIGQWVTGDIAKISFTPSIDFDGSVTNVSMKTVLSTQWSDVSKPSPMAWSDVAKALGTSYTDVPKPSTGTTTTYGTPIGLLMALTRPISVTTDSWTDVNTNVASWTNVAKAT